MGVAANILEFFHRELPDFGGINAATTGDFINDNPRYKEIWVDILILCQQLEALGYLIPYFNPEDGALVKRYYAPKFDQRDALYGVYDFKVFGFPSIRTKFLESVIALIPTRPDGDEDIGSAFLIESNYLVTASHCIIGMKQVIIKGLDTEAIKIENIWIPADDEIDLAIIKFNQKPFRNAYGFQIEKGYLLDEVMTMGYPPVPNFDAILVAETAKIVAIKSTTGEIIAHEAAYRTGQNYFLISARIKGGNSGGPVIGKHGRVIGVVTEYNGGGDSSNPVADTLGFGVVTPIETLETFLEESQKNSDKVKSLNFEMIEGGFKLI